MGWVMSQSMPEKLELIARCLRDGVDIQWRETRGGGWFLEDCFKNEIHVMGPDYEYRAKPVKPRTIHLNNWPDRRDIEGNWIDLDNKRVRAALEAAGIEI
jgi:hypothetical protein